MPTTVKKDEERKTVQYDTMTALMTDMGQKNTDGYSIYSISVASLTVVFTKPMP